MLELHLEKVTVRTNERDVSYFVLNFGGVFFEGPGTRKFYQKTIGTLTQGVTIRNIGIRHV